MAAQYLCEDIFIWWRRSYCLNRKHVKLWVPKINNEIIQKGSFDFTIRNADRIIANNVDLYQTARNSLIWVFNLCSGYLSQYVEFKW